MNPLYPQVAERANHRCEYCRAPARAFNFPFDVEHIVPRVAHGDTGIENLALACHSCNAFKSVRQSSEDPETKVVVRLFHPRLDRWEDHFAPSADKVLMLGRTPIGRATIVALHFNSAEQQLARSKWKRLNLFP